MSDPRTDIEAKIQAIEQQGVYSLQHSLSPKHYRICVPVAPVLAEPDYQQSLQTQFVFGTCVRVHAYCTAGGEIWALCQQQTEGATDMDEPLGHGYIGFVPRSVLMEMDSPSHQISVLKAPVLTRPSLKSPLRSVLPLNAKIKITNQIGDYRQVQGLGYVHQDHIVPLISRELGPRLHSDHIHDFVDVAELHFGLPYIWGGNSSDGLDCSGLVQSALCAVGFSGVPRDTDQQEKVLGHALDFDPYFSGLLRGDLVFWPGHVGVMGDETMLLHANAHHMAVAIEPLADVAARIEDSDIGPVRSIKRLG